MASADPAKSLDANREFHLALVSASGNPHLAHFAELLWVARISVAIYTAQAAQAGGTGAWAEEHEAIIDAIAAGDGDRRRDAHARPHRPASAGRALSRTTGARPHSRIAMGLASA